MTIKQYPKNYYIALGIMFGFMFGLPISIALKNPAFIGASLPIGLAIGLALEKDNKNKTPADQTTTQKTGLLIGLIAILGIVVLVSVILLNK